MMDHKDRLTTREIVEASAVQFFDTTLWTLQPKEKALGEH